MSLLSSQLLHLPKARRQPVLPTTAGAAASVSSSRPLLRLRPLRASSRPLAVSSALTAPVAADAASDGPATSAQQPSGWAEFAARVSGEWDGFGADFTTAGDPLELPENVVPEAYRDWGVEVFDWQTQCPTLADPANPRDLRYRLIRLLPTVGCEADAATVHSSQQRHAASTSAFAFGLTGSYVAAWPVAPAVAEVEHCIVHPENREVRVRVAQTVAVGEDLAGALLRRVKVFSEQWYGPFRNGEQLGGCAVRETGFAAGERLRLSKVVGPWESNHVSVARFSDPDNENCLELSPDKPWRLFRDETGIVTLPKQLWSLVKEHGEGELVCEVGWVLDDGNAVTSRCVLSKDGNVEEVAVAYESLAS